MADSGIPAFSGSLEYEELDAVYHSNAYTIFELNDPSKTYVSNLMRLNNIRFTSSAGGKYHETLGVIAGVKHMELQLGGTTVNNQRFVNRCRLFQAGLSPDNASQATLQNRLLQASAGYQVYANYLTDQDDGVFTGAHAAMRQMDTAQPPPPDVTGDSTTTPDGEIRVADILSFLATEQARLLNIAATGTIRLKIEWEDMPNTIVPAGTAQINSRDNPPQLCVTYSRDPAMAEMAMQMLGSPVTFPVWLHDQFIVPAATFPTAGATVAPFVETQQMVSVTPRAFNGQFVQRMLLINEPTVNLSSKFGRLQSTAMLDSIQRPFINGVPEFGTYGIHTPARRATILHDTFEGDHTHAIGMESTGIQAGFWSLDSFDDRYGTQEFTGFMVSKPVADFRLEWQRTTVNLNTASPLPVGNYKINQQLVVHMFGEVYHTRLPNGVVTELATL